MLLYADSTFIIKGLDSTSDTTLSGWNVDQTMKGKWTLVKKLLSFWLEDVRMPLTYKVVKLSEEELIFIYTGSKGTQIKYKRII